MAREGETQHKKEGPKRKEKNRSPHKMRAGRGAGGQPQPKGRGRECEDPLAGADAIPLIANFDALFEGVRELGSGAFGTTYLIRRRDTGCDYALKVLHRANPSLLNGRSVRSRSFLQHPTAVRT